MSASDSKTRARGECRTCLVGQLDKASLRQPPQSHFGGPTAAAVCPVPGGRVRCKTELVPTLLPVAFVASPRSMSLRPHIGLYATNRGFRVLICAVAAVCQATPQASRSRHRRCRDTRGTPLA